MSSDVSCLIHHENRSAERASKPPKCEVISKITARKLPHFSFLLNIFRSFNWVKTFFRIYDPDRDLIEGLSYRYLSSMDTVRCFTIHWGHKILTDSTIDDIRETLDLFLYGSRIFDKHEFSQELFLAKQLLKEYVNCLWNTRASTIEVACNETCL